MFDSWAKLVDAADVKTLMTLFDDGVVWSSPDPDQVVSGKEALPAPSVRAIMSPRRAVAS